MDALELELWAVVGCHMVLGTEHRLTARPASAPELSVISTPDLLSVEGNTYRESLVFQRGPSCLEEGWSSEVVDVQLYTVNIFVC